MIKVSKFQRDNLRYAIGMWKLIAKEEVAPGLKDYNITTGCGTVACFGGHVALDTYFKIVGVKNFNGMPVFLNQCGGRAARLLFGYSPLFSPRGRFSSGDEPIPFLAEMPSHLTDHDVVTNRLNWLLENSEVQP